MIVPARQFPNFEFSVSGGQCIIWTASISPSEKRRLRSIHESVARFIEELIALAMQWLEEAAKRPDLRLPEEEVAFSLSR
jgi:hypothetical protein